MHDVRTKPSTTVSTAPHTLTGRRLLIPITGLRATSHPVLAAGSAPSHVPRQSVSLDSSVAGVEYRYMSPREKD